MKKLLFAFVAAPLFSVTVTAQEKGSLSKAQTYLEDGKLEQAKKEIDAVLTDPKKALKGQNWFYKGQIYQAIALSDKPEVNALALNAFEEAIAAYKKVQELDKPKSFYVERLTIETTDPTGTKIIEPVYKVFSNQIIEKAAALVDAGKNKEAIPLFEKALLLYDKSMKMQPSDTTINIYLLQLSHGEEDEVRIVKYAQKLLDMGVTNKEFVYQTYVNVLMKQEKLEEALKIARLGRAAFPNDNYLSTIELNILIKTNKVKEAIAALEKSLTTDKNNVQYLFNLAILYENDGDKAKAIELYKQALSIDPNFFDAMFNLAVTYVNEGQTKIKECNELIDAKGKIQDKAKYDAADAEGKAKLKLAMPLLEKVNKMKPDDKQIIRTLVYTYQILGMQDKAKPLQAKLSDEDED
jgi:tetratricopeptide (TPR) repeat protein